MAMRRDRVGGTLDDTPVPHFLGADELVCESLNAVRLATQEHDFQGMYRDQGAHGASR